MYKEFHGKFYYMEVPSAEVGLRVLQESLEEPYKSAFDSINITFKCIVKEGRHFVVATRDGELVHCCGIRGNPLYWYSRLIAFKQKVTNEYYKESAQK